MISKLTNTSAFAVILICFLFPFLSIKCGDKKITQFTGLDLVTGKEFIVKSPADHNAKNKAAISTEFEIGSAEKEKMDTNWFMVGILLAAVCGLLVSLFHIGKKRVSEIICGGAGFLLLLLMAAILNNRIKSEAGLGNEMLGLEIHLGYEIGFWFMFLLLLGVIIYNSVLLVLDSKKQIPPSSPFNDYTPPASLDKIK
jgi:hypothetical protein